MTPALRPLSLAALPLTRLELMAADNARRREMLAEFEVRVVLHPTYRGAGIGAFGAVGPTDFLQKYFRTGVDSARNDLQIRLRRAHGLRRL